MEQLKTKMRREKRRASVKALVDVAYDPNKASRWLSDTADLVCQSWDSAGALRAMLGILKGRGEGKTLEVSVRDAMIAVDSEQARIGQRLRVAGLMGIEGATLMKKSPPCKPFAKRRRECGCRPPCRRQDGR